MDKITLGKRIKSTRLSKGLKAKELAKKAEISASYLSEVEKGISAISGERLLKIAKALEVSISFLMEEEAVDAGSKSDVRIPHALAKAGEELNLPFNSILALLEGHQSLFARRSSSQEKEWQTEDWLEYYEKVKPYLAD